LFLQKTARNSIQQGNSSHAYIPLPVAVPENGSLTYSQYLELVKIQVKYAKDIHDIIICAALNISPSEG
jgi:mediator of RNA polymerase II transcription subunit 29